MRRFLRRSLPGRPHPVTIIRNLLGWYGAGPLNLLTMVGCFALAGYAAAELLPNNAIGIPVWFIGAVIGHDLFLFPLYTLADRSAGAVLRHRAQKLRAVPVINYVRVPAVLSGLLLLVWFPLVFRLPTGFPSATTLPLDPYLWHWLAVTGVLFLISAVAFALRVRAGRYDPDEIDNGPAPATPIPEALSPPSPADPSTAITGGREMSRPSTIADRVAEMHAATAAALSSQAMSAFPREQAEPAARVPTGIARVGTVLPDVQLLDVHGGGTTLHGVTGDGLSVLIFYRGAWCPYCDIALSVYQEQLFPQLAERGVRLVAVSPQKPDGSLSLQQKHSLDFAVVSDPGNAIAGRLGLLIRPSPPARDAQLQLGLDLAGVNADGTDTLPMPATVILDAGHVLRWIDVHPDYSTRTEPRQVIDALDALDDPAR